MMKILITPSQVLALAFNGGEYLSQSAISEADIIAATARYLQPVVGQELLEALQDEEYEGLLAEYVAPALAFAVRNLVQPSLTLRTGDSGVTAPKTDASTAAERHALIALMHSIKSRMRELIVRLSDHLNSHADSYPEYNPKLNILNRCSIDGGLVQIF